MTRLRVLLSQASNLTAREHLTVLGAVGVPVEDDTVPGQIPCPYFLKSAFSTGGPGVRRVRTPAEHARALTELRASGQELIAQAPAPGQYGQVQACSTTGG